MIRRIVQRERRPLEGKGKYVYCVIRRPSEQESFDDLGFEGEKVYTLDYRELAPVISDATIREYSVGEEEVEVHRKVVERIMQEHSVLPVAYGMVFKSRKLLQIAMGAGYQAMQEAFGVVGGRIELGIKVFLPKEIDVWDEKKGQNAGRTSSRSSMPQHRTEKTSSSSATAWCSMRPFLWRGRRLGNSQKK